MNNAQAPDDPFADPGGVNVYVPQAAAGPFPADCPLPPPSPFAPFDARSCGLYERILTSGLIAVSASTGNFKTTFMLNATAYALVDGRKVGVLSMEMQAARIWQRLVSILGDMPFEQAVGTALYPHCEKLVATRLFLHDASSKQITAGQIGMMVDASVNCGIQVLIIDGLETVKRERSGAQSLVEAVDILAHKAAEKGIAVLFSSQLNREAEGREIATLSNLSAASEKAHRPDRVLMIGRRDANLLTVQFAKERDAPGIQQVYRLEVRPSLRLTPINDGGIDPAHENAAVPAPMYVNVADGDLPSQYMPDAVPESEEDHAVDVFQPSMKPYHGTAGFVPVGRAVFASPMFTARDADNVFRLMDLYAMAQFEPTEMMAPGTTQRVSLKRGEVLISIPILARRWDVSTKVVRTFLKAASRDGLIRVEVLDADGVRRAPRLNKGTSLGSPLGTSRKAVCQIVTCVHYHINDPNAKAAKPKKGT